MTRLLSTIVGFAVVTLSAAAALAGEPALRCDFRPIRCVRAPCPQHVCTTHLKGDEARDPRCSVRRVDGRIVYDCGRPEPRR